MIYGLAFRIGHYTDILSPGARMLVNSTGSVRLHAG